MKSSRQRRGRDITDQDSPLEAGLEFAVNFDKSGGFIGREALLRQKESGIAKRLIQFRLRDPQPLIYHHEPIWLRNQIAGYVTSGNYGHRLAAAVGLGYVPMSLLPDFPELPDTSSSRSRASGFRPKPPSGPCTTPLVHAFAVEPERELIGGKGGCNEFE